MLDFFQRRSASIKNDLLSGLTVALALVPEAVAFALLAGVSPLIGLYSAFFIGLITSLLGGRPGMISGATGAMAVVVVTLIADHGIEYLFPTVILCGLMQIGVGLARLGKLIRMVPYSVVLGFVNGLAIVIGMAQIESFKTFNPSTGSLSYLQGPPLWTMLGLVVLTMSIIWLLPKLTKAVPASLAAILIVSLISVGINQNYKAPNGESFVATVGDLLRVNAKASAIEEMTRESGLQEMSLQELSLQENGPSEAMLAQAEQAAADAGIAGGLPQLFFTEYTLPELSLETLWLILPYAAILTGVGLIESLMTLTLIDEITETRGRGNRECIGQGLANIVCGLFGGMGGCAMIGQSLINVNSGGRGRLSGATAAICLLMFVLFLSPWIEQIPMAALVGVMFMVVIGTFEWASIIMFGKVPYTDMLVMVLVAGYTVIMHDLASAVILGVVVSALVFAWRHATHIGADVKENEYGSRIYQLHGPLFFASVSSFKEMFDVASDPDDVVIDFYYSRVYDQSGLEAINALAEKYTTAGKRLHLRHLSSECQRLLGKAGKLVEVSVSEDPHYHVATDRLA